MASPDAQRKDQTQHLFDTLARYTTTIPRRQFEAPVRNQTPGDVILVTGTTGSFGCNILAQLCLDPDVKWIYALNRASPRAELKERQDKALKQRDIFDDCLRYPKYQLLEADLSQPLLGLSAEVYTEIQNNVTHIIHNAWSVNLAKPLAKFEDCLQGLRNLIDLALTSPQITTTKILFVSTMSVVRSYPELSAPEEHLSDPSASIGFGYPESKWVAEQMLHHASQSAGLPATSVRVGILCGDRNGHWATGDIWPLVVRSALDLKCLPGGGDSVLAPWVPTYEAASILCTMRHSNEPVLHLENPNPIRWDEIFGVFAKQLNVPLIPFEDWLSLLRDYAADTRIPKAEQRKRNPAVGLIPYLSGMDFRTYTSQGHSGLDTTKAVQEVPRLKDVQISKEIVMKWIKGWREMGFLPRQEALGILHSKL